MGRSERELVFAWKWKLWIVMMRFSHQAMQPFSDEGSRGGHIAGFTDIFGTVEYLNVSVPDTDG